MTLSGEFVATEQEAEKTYPTVFGIAFTPAVSGVLIAIVGLGAAIYLATTFIVPAYGRHQELRASIETKETDLTQKQETLKRINEVTASLDRAKALNQEVRGLFSTQKTLDTLLLDLNRLIIQSGAQLFTFTPDFATSGPIVDSSLGPELNGKLKRQVTTVAFRGTFTQTLKILQNLERLQTLLVVRDFSAELQDATGQGTQPQNQVSSSFKLHAYVPLTPEEAAAAVPAAPAQPGQPAGGQPSP